MSIFKKIFGSKERELPNSTWEELVYLIEDKYPNVHKNIEPKATESEILEFEKNINVKLPKEFYEMYRFSNGQNEQSMYFLFSMRFLSLYRIKWTMDIEFKLIDELEGEWDMCFSNPEKHIKRAYANEKWIPLFINGTDSYIGIDLDPDEKGVIGQVINFGINDERKIVIANSLNEFFEYCIKIIKSGEQLTYNKESNYFLYKDKPISSVIRNEKYETQDEIVILKDVETKFSIWLAKVNVMEGVFSEGRNDKFNTDFFIGNNESSFVGGGKNKASFYLDMVEMSEDARDYFKKNVCEKGFETCFGIKKIPNLDYDKTDRVIKENEIWVYLGSYSDK
ncbi:MAG: SMI1/KNR4 family protein [Saccharospirillaceae bacterium]|nr:SMI1/KNR4 family protein [Pseudomonadales bacterium]NRB80082.1 SMI1/KNR4 family protein [Saccharospirillaceae bacterium]